MTNKVTKHLHKKNILILLCILAVSFLGSYLIYQSNAATSDSLANLWVDNNSSLTHSCIRQSITEDYASASSFANHRSCNSLNDAYAQASPGDLILVKGGTYGDQIINDVPSKDGAAWNGTSGIKPITIRSASGETVTANDLTTHASNLILDGINTTISDAAGVGEPTILGPLHDVTLQNLKGRAFYITGAAYNITIKNVEIGPRVAGSGSQIKTATNGGDDPDPAQQPHDILIDGLYMHDYTTDNPGTGHMDCLHVFYHYNLIVKNSKFLRCGLPNAGYGILLGSNGPGRIEHDVFENNVFDGAIAGFALRGGTGEDFNDVQVRYNSGSLITTQTTNTLNNVNWIANAASDIAPCRANSYSYNVSTSTACGSTDLKANPGFKNSAAGDYTLLTSSPAVGHGNPADFPQKDFLGIARPQGSGPDAGAYEYQSGGTTPPTCSTKQGDATGDNAVNILDISKILSLYGQTNTTDCADANKDGSINILDISLVLSKYGS